MYPISMGNSVWNSLIFKHPDIFIVLFCMFVLGIPQLVLMTKVDEACPLVSEDLQNVYMSHYIQRKVSRLAMAIESNESILNPNP